MVWGFRTESEMLRGVQSKLCHDKENDPQDFVSLTTPKAKFLDLADSNTLYDYLQETPLSLGCYILY